ncbi:MAG: AbrB/MazE/SpoVT family DNA-binding domain-containing protein [Candidatus Omnitrophica bacterium]|nr:AbrB/MazE/SpoVT family DNA-binding domain-containing protein [Candidatus Omnitrophota bacterium]
MSVTVAKITRHYQVVIPKEVREKSGLKEGDLVSFQEKDGEIIMNPVRVVRKDQTYFWSKRWQESIKKSEEEIKKGDYKIYRSGKELKKDVEK